MNIKARKLPKLSEQEQGAIKNVLDSRYGLRNLLRSDDYVVVESAISSLSFRTGFRIEMLTECLKEIRKI